MLGNDSNVEIICEFFDGSTALTKVFDNYYNVC